MRWPTKNHESLEIASGVGPDLALSEHGPCFVGSIVTRDDVSLTIKIACVNQETLNSENHWTPLDLETGSIVCPSKRLRDFFGHQSSAYSPATRHGRALAKWGPTTHESSCSLSSSPYSISHSSTANGSANGNADFLARWPEPATGNDHSRMTSFNSVGLTRPKPFGDNGI